MSDNQEKKLDDLIKDTFAKAADNVTPPSVQAEWEKFEQKYGHILFANEEDTPNQKENNLVYIVKPQDNVYQRPKGFSNTNRTRVRLTAIACIAAIIFGLFMIKPQSASALGKWFIQIFTKKSGETTEFIQRSVTKEGGNTGQYIEIDKQELSLEEARSQVPYAFLVPDYIPPYLEQRKIYVEKIGEIYSVALEYYQESNLIISIIQKKYDSVYTNSTGYDTDDSLVNKIQIGNYPANLVTFKDGSTKLVWNDQSLFYEIRGVLNKDEIIKIAQSMK